VGWAKLMAGASTAAGPPGSRRPAQPALRSVATDGETFGHHHEFAEMALAKAISVLREEDAVRLENYASFLAREGARGRATLVEPSAWSCAHGVERWRSDCGCRADFGVESSQAWRGPLRASLEWLARGLHDVFDEEGGAVLADPWLARDGYGAVVAAVDDDERTSFVADRMRPRSTDADRLRALELLEMERNALRLFTSCAWFFDDVARLEPRQVLRYAARAMDLAGPAGDELRPGFVERLRAAESNDAEVGTAAEVFEETEVHTS